MKKSGFTLAEILITLGIIGVLSALMAPTITNIMPDKDKITMLKLYNAVSNTTQALLSDPNYYYPTVDFETGEVEISGLASPAKSSTPRTRYPQLIRKHIAPNSSGTDTNFKCDNNVSCSFSCIGSTNDNFKCDFKITMDYKGKSTHCSYNKTSCPRPDRFDFEIDNFGTIRPADNLSKAYLMTQMYTNQRKKDYEKASKL